MRLILLTIGLALPIACFAQMRPFTDGQGRTIQAEMAGISGGDVIMLKDGVTLSYPLAKLSDRDKAFVQAWQSNPPPVPHLQVRLFEKQGFSSAGTFAEDDNAPPSLPNIPGVVEVQKRETFRYDDVEISNPGATQASRLTLAYQLYVVTVTGSLVVESGSEALEPIASKGVVTVPTRAISSTRTKTTTITLSARSREGLTIGSKNSRASERFGGCWARVYAQDGKVVGEARKLIPEIEQTKPAWVGPTAADGVLVQNLDQVDPLVTLVKQRLEKIQELLKSLPPLPEPGDEKPPLPPGPPGT